MSESFLTRVQKKACRSTRFYLQKRRDLNRESLAHQSISPIQNSYVQIDELNFSQIPYEVASYLTDMYLNHRYDILGTGWIPFLYSSKALGVEGHKYQMNVRISEFDRDGAWLSQILLPVHIPRSNKIWRLVSQDYPPIDWQMDYRSGYRWSQKKWYKDLPFTPMPGADVKMPWELARLQHLVQLGMFARVLPHRRPEIIQEFRNQTLDFLATNPLRMGFNWVCTMDVGIRAANLLLAHDLIKQMDSNGQLDSEFEAIFAYGVYEHGLHIVHNLEYSLKHSTNHYLSNIVALLFIAAYMACMPETDAWLAFSVQELIKEVERQFYPAGGNFESSTSYHRLSGEFVAYSTALILGMNENKKEALTNYEYKNWKLSPELKSPAQQEYNIDRDEFFPEWYIERLSKAGLFTAYLKKPTGEIPQIGDNDSGRFFRLSPNGEFLTNQQAENKYLNLKGYNALLDEYNLSGNNSKYWDENTLNHSTFLSALFGFFDCKEFKSHAKNFPLEQSLIRSLARNKKLEFRQQNGVKRQIRNLKTEHTTLPYQYKQIIQPKRKLEKSLRQNLQLRPYFDFGIYIFSSDRIHLTVCATPAGQNGNGGHTHNDKLSFELNIDGEDYYRDPGTYLYYPLIEKRNLFRSATAHNLLTPQGMEPNNFRRDSGGLFSMDNDAKIKLLQLEDNSITIRMDYRHVTQIREFEIADDCVKILDFSNCELKQEKFAYYSNGYGKLMACPV